MSESTQTISASDTRPAPRSRSDVFLRFVEYLKTNGVRYCVLGDTRLFPQEISSDVDIVVSMEHYRHMDRHVLRFADENDLLLVQKYEHKPTGYYYVVTWWDGDGPIEHLSLDICGDWARHTSHFLDNEFLLRGRRPVHDAAGDDLGFVVPGAVENFTYYLMKRVDKLSIDTSHMEVLSHLWREQPRNCRQSALNFFSAVHVDALANCLERGVTLDTALIQQMRHAMMKRLGVSISLRFADFFRVLRRFRHPTGVMAVFYGSDGSGKSTVIERLMERLPFAFRNKARFHLKPKPSTSKSRPVTDPHGAPPRGIASSIVKMAYLLTQYITGYWRHVHPRLVCSTLVIFDRYYHDLLVDPVRYRYGGPRWLAHVIGRLVPRSDLTVLLDAPSDVLYSRKQEVEPAVLDRQRGGYLELMRSSPDSVIVDATRSIDEVTRQVELSILEYMARRMRRRVGA